MYKAYTCNIPEWQIHPSKLFLLVKNGAHNSGIRGGHQDVAQILSFVLSIPILEQVFSIMNCYWRNEHKSSIYLIKGESAIKMNYKYTYKNYYTLVLKDKDISKQQSQQEVYF